MPNVRILELTAAEPSLKVSSVALDALEGALRDVVGGPRFRLLELGDAQVTFSVVRRLALKALQVMRQPTFARLVGAGEVRLEVSGAPRELRSTVAAMRASARVAQPALVVDVRGAEPAAVPAMLAAWEALLVDVDPPRPRARIERAPPAPLEDAALAETIIAQLLADNARFTDSVAVGRALSRNPAQRNPKMVTTRARKDGAIFGVWDGNAYRYPRFQFDAAGQPRPEVEQLIPVLPRDADGSGRDAALWLFAPDAELDDRSPAEVFPEDPARVITLAQVRQDGGHDLD